MKKSSKKILKQSSATRRQRIFQADVPANSIEKALRVARAIHEQYGGKPVTPIDVAKALDMTPTSGPFKTLCGSSLAFGLTEGGYNAQQISLTSLAERILAPTEEGDDTQARKEALLKPRVFRDFLDQYNGKPFPRDDIAENVLAKLSVPRDRTKAVLSFIKESAEDVGVLSEIKGKKYVQMARAASTTPNVNEPEEQSMGEVPAVDADSVGNILGERPVGLEARKRRVYLSHGKNRGFIEPLKKLLAYGELEAVVSVEQATSAKAIPDKVREEMRSCGGAIIHVDDEGALGQGSLNGNVLIEIGAAMYGYGDRFILLVKEGIELPSNLQGLFKVVYKDDRLDGDTTLQLLQAVQKMKERKLPEEN